MIYPFYLILDTAKAAEILLPFGVCTVQLRIKAGPQANIRTEIRATQAACQKYNAQLVVNDHWQLAIDEGCDYVHLGQEDLDTADITAIRAAGIKIGISTHDDIELARALAIQPDYIALGPIYPTTLKQLDWAPQGLAKIGQWKARVGDIPLVCIGGITLERAPDVWAAGANSVAVSTDVLGHESPEARVMSWIKLAKVIR